MPHPVVGEKRLLTGRMSKIQNSLDPTPSSPFQRFCLERGFYCPCMSIYMVGVLHGDFSVYMRHTDSLNNICRVPRHYEDHSSSLSLELILQARFHLTDEETEAKTEETTHPWPRSKRSARIQRLSGIPAWFGETLALILSAL